MWIARNALSTYTEHVSIMSSRFYVLGFIVDGWPVIQHGTRNSPVEGSASKRMYIPTVVKKITLMWNGIPRNLT